MAEKGGGVVRMGEAPWLLGEINDPACKLDDIGVGAYSTLAGGKTFLPEIMYKQNI